MMLVQCVLIELLSTQCDVGPESVVNGKCSMGECGSTPNIGSTYF